MRRGITLLLVILILSSLFSISIGIFNVVFGELRISGEINDSFIALYAADQGAERHLYIDRSSVSGGLPDGFDTGEVAVISGGCYRLKVRKITTSTDGLCSVGEPHTEVDSSGQYRCGPNPPRVIKRRLCSIY
jgi:hypothetical protein